MRRAWRFLVSVLLAAVLASHAWGAEAKPTRVTVQCAEPKLVAGVPLRVLKPGPKATLRLTEDKATFDAQGEASVDLAAGSYVFEALAARKDGTIIAIHSGPAPVPRSTPVKINAGDPQPITLRHQDEEVKITEVALRSAASVDDVRWHRTTPGASPKVILTPGESAPDQRHRKHRRALCRRMGQGIGGQTGPGVHAKAVEQPVVRKASGNARNALGNGDTRLP